MSNGGTPFTSTEANCYVQQRQPVHIYGGKLLCPTGCEQHGRQPDMSNKMRTFLKEICVFFTSMTASGSTHVIACRRASYNGIAPGRVSRKSRSSIDISMRSTPFRIDKPFPFIVKF